VVSPSGGETVTLPRSATCCDEPSVPTTSAVPPVKCAAMVVVSPAVIDEAAGVSETPTGSGTTL